jgi:anti-sigma regulatory factor (Ser/Thr protein kinase)
MVASDEPALAVHLPNDVRAPAAAREVLRGALPTSARDGIGQIIELLTDELVSNVVCHVGAPMQLRAFRDPSSVRIEVDDPSTECPVLQRPEPLDDHGRGILLIETLATVWGVDLREDGKTVWFEIETPPLDG